MELEKNRLTTEYEEVIEHHFPILFNIHLALKIYYITFQAKDAQIRQLLSELERKSAEIARLQCDPESEAVRKSIATEIRSELEKESKNRLDLLTKGILQKKDEVIAKIKKEMQYELKLSQQEYNFSMKWLEVERDRLKEYIISNSSEGRAFCDTVESDIKSAINSSGEVFRLVYGTSIATQTDSINPLTEVEKGCTSQLGEMKESTFAIERLPELIESTILHEDALCSNSQLNDAHVQTKISLKSMCRMISIEDIGVGSTVLVIWNNEHKAYMLFSLSVYSYFVKESSVLRLGLSTTHPDVPRREWIIGKVSQLEFCIIRKANNRYHLPVDTKVYRVDIKPLDP
ncbi:hypothetical protein DICVIV_13001 [Dictyocaulus viviparus]|uniref:Autophagy-related protein 11 C-terminal domain-containing protein n=1 Tax=Dictyocaulus viviparus TaxID=29172 RepID=A0A0D8X8Z7_DICVI|nr:hypothetical protein DICVIV_13001 [Dictyocaulus viviparus]